MLSIASKILFPWIFPLLILLPTYLRLAPTFGTFGYNPTSGECNIVNPKVVSVLEVIGTYVPFVLMAVSYSWIGATVWKRQAVLRRASEDTG